MPMFNGFYSHGLESLTNGQNINLPPISHSNSFSMINSDTQDIHLNPKSGGGVGGLIQAGSVPTMGPGPRPPPKMLYEYDNEM